MAEASFTIRAVDATRAAFISVQSSLSRIGRATNQLASITRAAFGATAIAKTFQAMERRLTNIGTLGEEMGFSDEQIASAIKMERAIEGISNLLMQIPVLLAQVGIKIKDSLVGPTENVEDTIRRFRENLERTRVSGLRSDIKALGVELENLGRPAGEVADSLLEDAAALRREADAMRSRDTAGALDLERQALQKIIQSRQTGLDVAQRLADAQQDYAEASSRSNAAQRAGLSLEETKLRAFKIERIMGETMESMRRLEKEGKPTGFLAEEYIAKAKEYVALSKQIAKIEEERGRLARDAGEMIALGFEDAIFSGQKLSQVLRQLALDLMRMLFNQMITQQLAASIGTFFGMPPLPGRAVGGSVTGRSAYLVGERGPEVFVPGTSGAIIPNSKLGAGGGAGGGSVNITYNIQSGVSRAELAPILESERKRLKAEIPDMVRRGGSYRAAFA